MALTRARLRERRLTSEAVVIGIGVTLLVSVVAGLGYLGFQALLSALPPDAAEVAALIAGSVVMLGIGLVFVIAAVGAVAQYFRS